MSVGSSPAAPAESNREARRWLLALMVLCAVAFVLRFQHIRESLPYPTHTDERHIATAAVAVLKTGDYHPGTLRYPALPAYIAALAMAVGFVNAAADADIGGVDEIGSVHFPRYRHPRIVGAARLAFALLSVFALALSGWLAWLLIGRPGALLTAPLVLFVSDYYFTMSWRYLNVDIVATLFVTAGFVAAVHATRNEGRYSLLRLAAVPAACAGLAAASKYTHVLLLVPVVLGILLFAPARQRWLAMAVACLTTGFVFVAANPFSVLDLPTFLDDLAYEARHYASGQWGHESDAGWGKLVYYAGEVVADFGVVALIAGGVGLGAAAWSDWRRTAIIASYALALLCLLSAQRVEFARNILPLFPLLAVFVAAGIHFAYDRLLRAWGGALPRGRQQALFGGAVFVLLSSLVLHVPLTKLDGQLAPVENSRKAAVSWISSNLPKDTTLIVPSELGLAVEPLTAQGFPVQILDFMQLDTGEALDAVVADIPTVAVVIPRWEADYRCVTLGRCRDFASLELVRRVNEAATQASLRPIASFGSEGAVPTHVWRLAPHITIAVPAGS